MTKPGDVDHYTRVHCYEAILSRYPQHTVKLALLPLAMRMGGPREAVWHAIIRKNHGCTHLIVGRDHAGIGDYYGPFDAHHIFDTLPPGSMETEPLKIDITFYCYKCDGMATGKTCPHEAADRLAISGTRLREMFANHEPIPPEFSRPEVVAVLREFYGGGTG